MIRLQRSVDFALPLCMLGTLAALLGDYAWGIWLARPAIVIYLMHHRRTLPKMAQGLLMLILISIFGIALFHPLPTPIIFAAWDSLSFFATFITSLGLLRVAAASSPLVRRAGNTLIKQKPSYRYPTLSLGTALFGMIINVGVLSLFSLMIVRSNTLKSANGNATIQATREQRMALATLRGFALAPLTSPLSVTLAVILSAFPQLSWGTILPVALPMAMLFFFLGWASDWWQRPKHLAALVAKQPPPPLLPLYQFAGVALLIALSVFVIAYTLRLPLPTAVLVACPLSAFIWLAYQRKRLQGGLGIARASAHLQRNAKDIFGSFRNEVAFLSASACLGTLLTPLIDQAWLAEALQQLNIQGTSFALLALTAMVLLAQIGVNPIISATLIASLFPDPELIRLHPAVLAVALMCGWSLSMITSPFTASLALVSQQLGRSYYEVGWQWNKLFFCLLVPTIIIWLYLVQWLIYG